MTQIKMEPSRRGFLSGLASFLAAPAVVRAASLMPVRGIIMDAGITSVSLTSAGSGYAIADEITWITRKAFVPKIYVDLWSASPLAKELLRVAPV